MRTEQPELEARTVSEETSANQVRRASVERVEEPERRETRDGEECRDREDQLDLPVLKARLALMD